MSNTVYVEPVGRSWTTTKVVLLILAILTGGYLAPAAVAAIRDVPWKATFWVNLLLGWTIIGWIVALIMSLKQQRYTVAG